MSELARFLPFDVAAVGLRFVDGRSVSDEELARAMHGIDRFTFGAFDEAGSPFGWVACDDSVRLRNEIEAKWDAYALENPDADLAEWKAAGGAIVNDSSNDPRLQNVRLVATELDDPSEIVGALVLQNVLELGQVDGVTSLRVFPLAGLPARAAFSIPGTWAEVARFVLNHDLELEGGDRASVDEILLPPTPEASYTPTAANRLGDLWAVLEDETTVVEHLEGEATPRLVRARRRG